MRRFVAPLTVLLLLIVAVATAQTPTTTQRKEPDVPFVPTHERLVVEMLNMAKVKKDDLLYDLGSGDGRIPITAARMFGTRGVGYDIDPERVREARENAKKAGVAHLVRFEEQDIFQADFKEATVVTLYLLPAVNLKLRPKLLSDLKPGTRVVSHNYDMGDWTPKQTKRMEIDGTDHSLFFWIVPPRAAKTR